ncbi:MAG: Bug family tripartite tricarboxylate transporter substrate binding protein [Burkholderiales bacterium]
MISTILAIRNSTTASVLSLLMLFSSTTVAQSYPAKPIKLISSSVAGNSGDTAMRMVIPGMVAGLGQPLLMEIRSAAGGQVAAVAVKTSPADGYTFLFASTNMVSSVFLVKDLPFDPRTDFAPVSKLISVPSLWAISAALPANNMNEFIAYAKKNPGKIAYGSTGVGTGFHLVGEAFSIDTGVSMLHVPYGSGGVAVPVTDLANDRIQLYFPSYISLLPVIKSGKVKVLSIVDRSRLKALPDVPTIFETLPNYTLMAPFFGMFAPAGTPRAITGRIQSEMKKALTPEVVTKLEELGATPVANTPDEFAQDLRESLEAFSKAVKAVGITPQ